MTVLNQFWDFFTGGNKADPNAAPSVTPYDYSALYSALYDLYNSAEVDKIKNTDTGEVCNPHR